jgi:putative oxidoreductase
MSRKLIVDIIGALFILLFFYTAINKLIEIDTLKNILAAYPLLENIPHFVAWALPITELVVVALLFFPRTRSLGLYASLVLMISFTLYLTYMLTFTTKLPCTCGGMLEKLTWPQHLFFNVVFVLLSITAIILNRRVNRNPDEGLSKLQGARG